MQIVYVADDGSEFETEQECKEYENRYNGLFAAFNTDIVAFDENNERLIYKPDVDPDDIFGEIKYIMFKNEEIIPVFLDARKNDKQLDKFIDKLKDSGEKFNFTYQVGSNIGNMLPSQIAGIATGGAGWASSLVLFTSAYGGNYKENKRQGYSELASNVVGLLSAAGELGTEFVLGKIAGIGMTKESVENLFQKFQSFFVYLKN